MLQFNATDEQVEDIIHALRKHFGHVHEGRERIYSYDYSWLLTDTHCDNEYYFKGSQEEEEWFRSTFPTLNY